MSNVLTVQDKLRENTELIAKLERSLAVHQSRATTSTLRSLYKLRHSYEEEFREAAALDSVDVVRYRLFEGPRNVSMALVGRALYSFQNLYSILYSVVTTERPKDTAHLSAEVVADTKLDFAYSFSGSVGFVFTMPNDRLLVGSTNLDVAMQDLFELAKSDSIESIKSRARQFGFAPVRAIYKWADALSSAGVGADIEWTQNEDVKGHIVLQPAEIRQLKSLIETTSDLEVDENELAGTLRGFDSNGPWFRFEPKEGAAIQGSVAETADIPASVSIPQDYIARVRTTTQVKYATDQTAVSHELLALFLVEGDGLLGT